MDSEQRRKRKRYSRPYSHTQFFSVRSLILCLSFFVCVLFLSSDRFSIGGGGSLHPVAISELSSSASKSILESASGKQLAPRVADRVLFPDHVLLLVSGRIQRTDELNCVYMRRLNDSIEDGEQRKTQDVVARPVYSVDEYDEWRFIARCPLPPRNYSASVSLRRVGEPEHGFGINQEVYSWETVAYAAASDGDTVVVFGKGLNLRPGRESDPAHFSCRFGLGNWDKNGSFALVTKAISAAQEVVRCALPRSIKMNPSKAQGIKVTVDHYYTTGGVPVRFTLPSVARIYDSVLDQRKKMEAKYELCVCSMVWNQAASLREWIMYHAWLGVQRWFIYDNNSDDGIERVIQELESENYNVTRHSWPWIKTQEAGFSHCALRAKDQCRWVGFMDVDEFFYFLFPTPQHPGLGIPGQNSLRTLVANFSSSTTIAEIRTACHSFGPSGLSSPPKEGVMVGYTCRLQRPERHKSIIRPDALDASLLNVVHHFRLKQGFGYLDLPQSIAVINHYKYQVWDSFKAKFYRRVATYVADWHQNQNEGSKDRAPGLGTEAIEPPNWRRQFCEVWDTGLKDFVSANLADSATGLLPWIT